MWSHRIPQRDMTNTDQQSVPFGRHLFLRRKTSKTASAGMTLIELMVACSILMFLAAAALPVARISVKRQKETQLRQALREMRTAIDRYKDAADRNQLQVQVGTE